MVLLLAESSTRLHDPVQTNFTAALMNSCAIARWTPPISLRMPVVSRRPHSAATSLEARAADRFGETRSSSLGTMKDSARAKASHISLKFFRPRPAAGFLATQVLALLKLRLRSIQR